jgi:hypothetical protein
MYALIVLSWFGGHVSGYSVTTHEFSSRAACDAAAVAILEMAKDGRSGTMKVWCVPR